MSLPEQLQRLTDEAIRRDFWARQDEANKWIPCDREDEGAAPDLNAVALLEFFAEEDAAAGKP